VRKQRVEGLMSFVKSRTMTICFIGLGLIIWGIFRILYEVAPEGRLFFENTHNYPCLSDAKLCVAQRISVNFVVKNLTTGCAKREYTEVRRD
jgi:hypothetical protein